MGGKKEPDRDGAGAFAELSSTNSMPATPTHQSPTPTSTNSIPGASVLEVAWMWLGVLEETRMLGSGMGLLACSCS